MPVRIPVGELQVLRYGRTAPARFDGKLWKFEYLPEWKHSVIHTMRGRRRSEQVQKANLDQDIKGSTVAQSVGVHTPMQELIEVVLEWKHRTFKTMAISCSWIYGQNFNNIEELSSVVRKPCDRIDLQYILLCDILIANADRRVHNLIYDPKKDVLIPVDYDSSFGYDRVPMTDVGVREVFLPYLMFPSESAILEINLLKFGELIKYFKSKIDYKFLNVIDFRLVQRAVNLEQAVVDFVKKYHVGVKFKCV